MMRKKLQSFYDSINDGCGGRCDVKRILVIGGGAAGMMAAQTAGQRGADVVLLERNEKLGKKIYITGKGSCNFTNACPKEDLISSVVSNPKFLMSAFSDFSNYDMMDFVRDAGVFYKVERGGRVFPVSDHASDITKALSSAMEKNHVRVLLEKRVSGLLISQKTVTGVLLENGEKLSADAVIVASGGKSYPATGSSGDGYVLAEQAGHSVRAPYPALVPLMTAEEDLCSMQGLSLKNVKLTFPGKKRPLYSGFGEMLFTHFGISGPLVLSASSYLGEGLSEGRTYQGWIDLKPAVRESELEERILRITSQFPRKETQYLLHQVLPSKMIPVFAGRLGLDLKSRLSELRAQKRKELVKLLKAFPLTVMKTAGFSQAVITGGGVRVNEVSPKTMESKLCRNLYFAGEVLDLDALTGGFNLQIAFSTGHLAGKSSISEGE